MKIVDRKTFMRMPKGTVFCKFPRFNEATRSYGNYLFGISEPYVKMDDTDGESVDFCAMGIGSGLEPIGSTGSSDTNDILTDMERNPGKEVAFEYSYGRDGMYEGDEVGFAIFSRDEVMLMIQTLRESLATAYKPEEKPMQKVTAYYYRIGELMGEPEIADGGRVVLHFAGGCGLHRCEVYDRTVLRQSQCRGRLNGYGYLTTTSFCLAEPIEGENLEQLAFVLPYNGRYINSYQNRFGYTVCCDGRGRIEATGIFKSPQGDVTEPEKMVIDEQE